MGAVKFANNATTTLAADITSTALTTMTVVNGAVFPAVTTASGNYFYATLVDTSGNMEIVKVTDVSGNVLTMTRGQEGTTARTFVIGNKVENRVTAAGLDSKFDKSGGTITGDMAFSTSTWTVTGTVTVSSGTVDYTGALLSGGYTVLNSNNTVTVLNKTLDTASGNVFKINGNTLSAAAGTATITFPNTTTTVVGTTNTQTLTNKTVTALGTASTINDNAGTDWAIGYREAPRRDLSAAGSVYTLATDLSDRGRLLYISPYGIAIPSNATAAYPVGTVIIIMNASTTASRTVTISTDTLRLAGTTATGVRTLAPLALATLVKYSSTAWIISGAGVS